MKQQSTLQFHDGKPGSVVTIEKAKYFRSILGRPEKGVWVPYVYKASKKAIEPKPLNAEETLKLLPRYGTFKRRSRSTR